MMMVMVMMMMMVEGAFQHGGYRSFRSLSHDHHDDVVYDYLFKQKHQKISKSGGRGKQNWTDRRSHGRHFAQIQKEIDTYFSIKINIILILLNNTPLFITVMLLLTRPHNN